MLMLQVLNQNEANKFLKGREKEKFERKWTFKMGVSLEIEGNEKYGVAKGAGRL